MRSPEALSSGAFTRLGSRLRRIRMPLAKLGFTALSLALLGRQVRSLPWATLAGTWGHTSPWILALPLVSVASTLCFAASWHLILNRLAGKEHAPATTFRAYLVSNLGKYLPGTIGNALGRAYVFGVDALEPGLCLLSYVLELLLVLGAAGLLMAAFGLRPAALPPLSRLILVGLPVLALPFALWAAFRTLWGRRLAQGILGMLRDPGSRKALVRVLLLDMVGLLLFGSILVLAVGCLSGTSPGRGDLLPLLSAFLVSWTTGFLAFLAPGGIGVRESVLVSLLGCRYGLATALTLAVVFRLITLLGDGLAAALGLCLSEGSREHD